MTIAQALLKTWGKEKENDTNTCKIAPLEYYLRFNYDERYVKLCLRVGIVPVSFTQWLHRSIDSI